MNPPYFSGYIKPASSFCYSCQKANDIMVPIAMIFADIQL